jgi:thiamine-phosphate pyrophosphorylase
MHRQRCRLYLITPPAFELEAYARVLEAALAAGDVAAVQLRLKPASDAQTEKFAAALKPIVQGAGAAFILNDRPDLAARAGADGVHIGQEDATYSQARAAMGGERIVGVSCHNSRDLAYAAAEAGADYVAFGAFYPTATKEVKFAADPELLEIWQQTMQTPCVAIGGVTVQNAPPLVRAGADFLAVSAGVWSHCEGPAAAIRAFNDIFDSEHARG